MSHIKVCVIGGVGEGCEITDPYSQVVTLNYLMERLEKIQYQTVAITTGTWQDSIHISLWEGLGWGTLSESTKYKIRNNMTPVSSFLLPIMYWTKGIPVDIYITETQFNKHRKWKWIIFRWKENANCNLLSTIRYIKGTRRWLMKLISNPHPHSTPPHPTPALLLHFHFLFLLFICNCYISCPLQLNEFYCQTSEVVNLLLC